MPSYDDVFHLEMLHRILHDCEGIDVRGRDHIGDIAMHEDLSRLEPHDLVGWDPRVRASNPEIFGILDGYKLGEVLWLSLDGLCSPFLVILHDEVEIVELVVCAELVDLIGDALEFHV